MHVNHSIREDGFIPSVSSLENLFERAGANRKISNPFIPVFGAPSKPKLSRWRGRWSGKAGSISPMDSGPVYPYGDGVNFKDHD